MIILGAGSPFRGQTHSVLQSATGRSRVLDWLLRSTALASSEVTFISGYQAADVRSHYPDLNYIYNADWEHSGAAASLFCADLSGGNELLVSYSDVLYRQSSVQALLDADGDVTILVDTHWRQRFENRSEEDLARCEKVNLNAQHPHGVTRLGRDVPSALADAEFVGLVRLSPAVTAWLDRQGSSLPASVRNGNLSQLLEVLRMTGFVTTAVDVRGDWAELNEPADLTHFVLGTKAQTLHRLRPLVQHSRIEDQYSFTLAQWQDTPAEILSGIESVLGPVSLVVRSSALSEDGFGSANAGLYDSVLGVDGTARPDISQAIEQVVRSYPDAHPDHQVLVQPMVSDVVASGVAFTCTLDYGGPYYVINYEETASTESITSGSSRDHQTLLVRHDLDFDSTRLTEPARSLVPALREIEHWLDHDALDIEFAVSRGGTVHILQVRPIAVSHEPVDKSAVRRAVTQAQKAFEHQQVPSPNVVGQRALFGVMPDWNPAEIIGTTPGRMAISLYRYLIMDDIWATQRAEYGYRDVRPQPLLTEFSGHPYVDIRASFNSLVPASVPDELAGRLVDFYLDWLARHPELHDKVEFDVVPTCDSLDFARWEHRLSDVGGFSPDDIQLLRTGLQAITRQAIKRTPGDWATIRAAENRFAALASAPLPRHERATRLLEEARRYGTLPFAHLARSAFVAVTLLRSARDTGVIDTSAYDAFMNSVQTVSHQFTAHAAAVRAGTLDEQEFIQRYGHLRPGTYDITAPSYAEDPERYIRPILQRTVEPKPESTDALTRWQSALPGMSQALNEQGVEVTPEALDRFLRTAIEGREYAKFVFTRHLSAALDDLAEFAAERGVSREVLAEVALAQVQPLHPLESDDSYAERMHAAAEQGRTARALARCIELPALICDTGDFEYFYYAASHPNFVGSGRVVANCVDLEQAADPDGPDLHGKIALIPQADPGYDWLFGQGIAGLVTLYGGANSHMAIRAAEFGLPAAIGVGETRFAQWRRADILELDAGNRRVQVVQ